MSDFAGCSRFEEGRAPARPLLISRQSKAAPQRGAFQRRTQWRSNPVLLKAYFWIAWVRSMNPYRQLLICC
ncbi:MAG: hypothetical protein KDI60_15985, partial [Xanthomonadales bacterium]|nr:hypothetical protein [Xanthomonadales bacterium]